MLDYVQSLEPGRPRVAESYHENTVVSCSIVAEEGDVLQGRMVCLPCLEDCILTHSMESFHMQRSKASCCSARMR